MEINGLIYKLPKEIKVLIGAFLIVLSIGFYTGLLFVGETSSFDAQGIEENYNGNEDIEEVQTMKFKKSLREMLTLVHSHLLSMSLIFFLMGGLLSITKLPKKVKISLIIEPFISVLLTFGGIYFLWKGLIWMKYVVIISGTLMTLVFTLSTLIVFWQLFKKEN